MSLVRPTSPRATNPGSFESMVRIQRQQAARADIVVDGERPPVDVERELAQLAVVASCLSDKAFRTTVCGSSAEIDNEAFWSLEDENGRIEEVV